MEILKLKSNPPMFVFPGEGLHIALYYACGEWVASDCNRAPANCLNCGSPYVDFAVFTEVGKVQEALQNGWAPPAKLPIIPPE